MRRTKIFTTAVLFTLSLFMLAGCGGSSKKYLTMGTNAEFPPFEYRERKRITGFDIEIKITGFDIEIAERVAKKAGKELKISDMSFDGLIPALQGGKIDMIVAGMSVTDERKKNVDFSDGYYKASQVIIVKSENSDINGAESLKGKKIGVQLGTTGDIEASNIADAKIQKYNAGFAAVMDLKNGKLDAVVLDYEPAYNFVIKNQDIKLAAENLTSEEYSIGVSKGNEELVKIINETLKEMKSNGEYDALVKKYFIK